MQFTSYKQPDEREIVLGARDMLPAQSIIASLRGKKLPARPYDRGPEYIFPSTVSAKAAIRRLQDAGYTVGYGFQSRCVVWLSTV